MDKKSLLSKIIGIVKNRSTNDDISIHRSDEEPLSTWAQQNPEGQLSVDVYETKDDIIIKSAIAGVSAENLDISIHNDMITIRGSRIQEETTQETTYLFQECYWGHFSRSIILPEPVKADKGTAEFEQGILTIRLPKANESRAIKITIDDNA